MYTSSTKRSLLHGLAISTYTRLKYKCLNLVIRWLDFLYCRVHTRETTTSVTWIPIYQLFFIYSRAAPKSHLFFTSKIFSFMRCKVYERMRSVVINKYRHIRVLYYWKYSLLELKRLWEIKKSTWKIATIFYSRGVNCIFYYTFFHQSFLCIIINSCIKYHAVFPAINLNHIQPPWTVSLLRTPCITRCFIFDLEPEGKKTLPRVAHVRCGGTKEK